MDYNIHVSDGNTKLGVIPSFSLTPVMTCRADAPCKDRCYARFAYRCYKQTRRAYDENTKLVQKNLIRFENQMNAWLDLYHPQVFRIHVSGDFCSYEYLLAWSRVIRKHPDTLFFCFTKQWDIVREYMKSHHLMPNFTIILSAWVPNGDVKTWCPPGDLLAKLPVAWVVDEKHDEQYSTLAKNIGVERIGKIRKCSGNCDECGMCFHLRKSNGDVLFRLH